MRIERKPVIQCDNCGERLETESAISPMPDGWGSLRLAMRGSDGLSYSDLCVVCVRSAWAAIEGAMPAIRKAQHEDRKTEALAR